MTSLQISKNNFLMVMSLFGVLVVGGAAVILSKNSAVKFKSGASNVSENLSNKLVKRDTPAFSPCRDLNMKFTYALLGNTDDPVNGTQTKPTGRPVIGNACTPLIVQPSLAEPFVGKRVSVAGTYQDGVFFATKVSDANVPNGSDNPKPSTSPRPSVSPKPIQTPWPSGKPRFTSPPIIIDPPPFTE